MTLLRIDNRTLRQKVYEQLKQKMTTAELLPGEKISLRNIAAMLGVSLMPVREALWQLERERAVVIRQNRNIYINQLSIVEFDEILDLRILLEGRAAAEACRRRPHDAPAAIKALLKELAASTDNHKQFLQLNHDFHLAIYKYSQMNTLIEMIDNLWMRVGPYIYLVAISRTDMMRSMESHEQMCEAFGEGDGEKMLRALQEDLIHAAAAIRPRLEADERQLLTSPPVFETQGLSRPTRNQLKGKSR